MEEAAASARERKRPREGDTGTPDAAAAAARELHYPYKPIADVLKDSSERVCLFAVVTEIGVAVQSCGSDETCKAGVSATFFAKDIAQLPCVKSIGDVISLHNVEIKHYEDFYVSFDKKHSSFTLFEGKVSAECSPYQTSEKYCSSKDVKERLTQIRTWLVNNPLGLRDLELQLRNLKSDSTFDLVCQVFHVCEHNGKWIFYVWDGTDTPTVELDCCSSDAEAVESSTLLEGPPLSREVLCKMPCVGTVMMIFSDRYINEVPYKQNSFYWARFCNITCKQELGFWKGIVLASSGVRLLSHEDDEVVDRLKMYDSRKANRIRCRPMASFPSNVADVDHKKRKCYSTLMESLTHREVTHNLKTLVRVVAAYPFRASEVCSLLNGEGWLVLTLEDPTARVHACVPKEKLVKFFNGSHGSLTKEVFIKKMNKLLGVPELEDNKEVGPLTRNPPWIWCCLNSYCLDKNDPWGTRRYQICDTTIRD